MGALIPSGLLGGCIVAWSAVWAVLGLWAVSRGA